MKDADKDIQKELAGRGLLVHAEAYKHDYPFCWRADSDPLIQYARPAWYIRTTREKDEAIANNRSVNWLPEHIKEGRMGDFLAHNVDWALSRERYWGTPLNLWINDVTGTIDAPPSMAAILERNPQAFDHFHAAKAKDPSLSEHLIVHKPWIDQVTWTKAGEEGVYRRVPEVIDAWFDSGCMPFAQWGYPHTGEGAREVQGRASPPTSSARRSTRRAAGSTRCRWSRRCSSGPARTRRASCSATCPTRRGRRRARARGTTRRRTSSSTRCRWTSRSSTPGRWQRSPALTRKPAERVGGAQAGRRWSKAAAVRSSLARTWRGSI